MIDGVSQKYTRAGVTRICERERTRVKGLSPKKGGGNPQSNRTDLWFIGSLLSALRIHHVEMEFAVSGKFIIYPREFIVNRCNIGDFVKVIKIINYL